MSDRPQEFRFDKLWLRRSFDRASSTYDQAAVLQAEVRAQLLERLELTDLKPSLILDAGAGTGHASRDLKKRYPGATVVALDFSLGMLRAATRQQSWFRPFSRLCADALSLPFEDGCVQLILSNFMMPWCDPEPTFAEFRRVLAPRGCLSFSTLGPDTLWELRESWARAEGLAQASTRVSPFRDMHDIGDSLLRAGFAAPVLDVERYTLKYSAVHNLAADLKATGSRNAMSGRPKGLTGRRKFASMQSAYEMYRLDGRLPATYEVIYGQAWAPASATQRDGAADATVSLDELRHQLRTRKN